MSETDKNGLNLVTPRIHVKAGPQHIAAAFIQKFDGVVDDLVAPIDYTLADTEYGDNAGITILPHVRDFSITGPLQGDRRVRHAEPPQGVHLPPDVAGRRDSLRAQDSVEPGGRGLPAAAEQRRRRIADGVLRRRRARATTSRPASRRRCRRCWRARSSCSASRARRPWRKAGQTYRISDIDLASRLSFFIWNTRAGRRAGEGGQRQHAAHAGGAREAGAPDARGSARRIAVDAVRVAVAAAAGRREDSSRRAAVPRLRQRAGGSPTSARPSCSSTASCARIAASSTC